MNLPFPLPGVVALAFAVSGLSGQCASARQLNGFDVSNATIPVEEIRSGGPPRDGIPSIDHPKIEPAPEVNFLRDDDIVIGVEHKGEARAYPLRILVWHEIVNDVIADKPVTVTYCPLCGTAMVFDATVDGRQRSFGVSGLLFNSDVLMYDRETNSLWSQLGMRAVSGPAVGKTLTWLPSERLTWKAWRTAHPNGEVLSPDTGHRRNYKEDAYASYFASSETMFPVPITRLELPKKAWIVGVLVDGIAKAYPVDQLPAGGSFEDEINSRKLTIHWDPEARHAEVRGASGEPIPSVMVFWFAWQAFYPETLLWKA